MRAYAKEYVSDVVENQGKLFDLVAQKYPDKDTAAFINSPNCGITFAKPMALH